MTVYGLAVILVTKDYDTTRTFEQRPSRLYWLASPCHKEPVLLLTDKFQRVAIEVVDKRVTSGVFEDGYSAPSPSEQDIVDSRLSRAAGRA